ncbi:class I SAM-dependent methyltransferase [Streptomyces sp. NPDC048521]|uniref:class I SAM-dependent methyltransferase n=1 Tax=Streptomyces sp. NPDC048521 TaxID=3365566 RepID=UPI00371A834E
MTTADRADTAGPGYDDVLYAAFERRYQQGEDSWSDEGAMRRLVPLLSRHLEPRAAHVLDLGAGRGPDTLALLEAGHRVTATDLLRLPDWDAIERRWGDRVTFLRGDITELDLPEGEFDAVVDNGVLHHQDPAHYTEYLAAVHRSLRPGGLLAVSLFTTVDKRSAGVLNRAEDGRLSRWFTDDEAQSLLNAAGFRTLASEQVGRKLAGLAYLLVVASAVPRGDEP